ncbi:MAG TPA: DUF1778 domain-containing protein [Actinomycetota bacterium]
MAAAERELKTKRLPLRVSERQRAVIARAAEAVHKDVSAFVLESAFHNAEQVLADRTWFQLGDDARDRFLELLERPVTPISAKPELESLLKKPSVLEQGSADS